jgi:hypothetical protein
MGTPCGTASTETGQTKRGAIWWPQKYIYNPDLKTSAIEKMGRGGEAAERTALFIHPGTGTWQTKWRTINRFKSSTNCEVGLQQNNQCHVLLLCYEAYVQIVDQQRVGMSSIGQVWTRHLAPATPASRPSLPTQFHDCACHADSALQFLSLPWGGGVPR